VISWPTLFARRGDQVCRRAPWRLLLLAILSVGCIATARSGGVGASVQDRELQRGIERAIQWLSNTLEDQWRPDTAAMLQYLQRKFRHPRLEQLADAARARFQVARIDTEEFSQPFYRLVDPHAVTDTGAIAAISGRIGRITAAALHCDQIALPATYMEELLRLSMRGGYSLTHSLIAAQWLEENHCISGIDLEQLRSGAIPRLEALVDATRIPDDLRIEAIATLDYVGARDRVRQAWIRDVLRIQRDDGGWALTEARDKSHPHTTFLALWVLLEARYPETPAVPMIPEPAPNSP